MATPTVSSLIGRSEAICELRSEIEMAAASDAKVLITGESGVGKEIVARAIHGASARRNGEFVAVNCAGIPETLLESELFGHVKGSFTGAYRDKPGKLEIGAGGTIFLDEIGEMTLRMQGLLLRFLENREIQKVGAERVGTAANVRIISATNRALQEQISRGQFREDLFYRLNVVHLIVAPLRDRREDIPLFVDHFLRRFIASHSNTPGQPNGNGRPRVRGIAPEAVAALTKYSWPGNIRQLEHVIERLIVMGRQETIQVEDLPAEIVPAAHTPKRLAHDRRRTVADDLYARLVDRRESFWTAVYPLYMNREITRANVRDLVRKGLEESRGNYKIMLQMFNMQSADYKKFLDFLRKHDCQLPFKEYRATPASRRPAAIAEDRP